MSAHTFYRCDICKQGEPYDDQKDFENISVHVPWPCMGDGRTQLVTLHFCKLCFPPFAKEIDRRYNLHAVKEAP